ncbi:MAG: hypothetical protein A2293_01320 [Elusimicrobia bacterium RIFOXYB2_FULL_49_7]|nr:MAG: hypothetical protein A2293_01320 [Elusimicrobia bacterium RIFOXYB2_FULL_49_7]
MGNPLPEPLESEAEKAMSALPHSLRLWIGHHLNNALMPISGLLFILKSGRPITPEELQEVEESFYHAIQDIRALVSYHNPKIS